MYHLSWRKRDLTVDNFLGMTPASIGTGCQAQAVAKRQANRTR